jgi:hypothetical protein
MLDNGTIAMTVFSVANGAEPSKNELASAQIRALL